MDVTFETSREDAEDAGAAAPLLIVLGGGGFSGPTGEETLLRKLQLVLGLSHFIDHERGGVILAVNGELAVCILAEIFGARICRSSKVDRSLIGIVKDVLIQVLCLGVTLMLPVDFRCEKASIGTEAVDAEELPEEQAESEVSLRQALTGAPTPVFIGSFDGEACYASIDLEQGIVSLASATALPDLGAEVDSDVVNVSGNAAVETDDFRPESWIPRDIGGLSSENLRRVLRRCRGVLWNGALGVWEVDRWQRGTKAFLAAVAQRIEGGGEEEREEAQEEEEDDDDARTDAGDDEKDQDIDFDVAAAIGKDTVRMLPLMMDSHALMHFVSRSGDALTHILSGRPLPGLLACGKK
jgi:hypothetical protein